MQSAAAPQQNMKPAAPMYSSEEVSDQMNFVRKVYSILAIQLSVTSAFIFAVQYVDSLRHFFSTPSGVALYVTCAVLSIVLMCSIVCCFGRTAPLNMVLLGAFTLCETFMLGGITSQYQKEVVAMAGLATALVTISLTVYAWRTTVKIEVFGALAFVVYLAMLPMAIIGFFYMPKFLYTIYMCLGLIFYSLYLIIDTIIICGKEKHNGVAMDYNDYVIGALMLYIDIVMIFVYILRLLGSSK